MSKRHRRPPVLDAEARRARNTRRRERAHHASRKTPPLPRVTASSLRSARAATDPALIPVFDASLARTLALLLQAGIPRDRAAVYLLPQVGPALRDRTFEAWIADPLLLDAVNLLNGGEWHLLAKDARLQIAYDKTLAEMAYYLVTTKFSDEADGKTIAKLRECREAIRQAVSGASSESGDALDAFMRYLADVVAGKANLATPPQVYQEVALGQAIPVEAVGPTKES